MVRPFALHTISTLVLCCLAISPAMAQFLLNGQAIQINDTCFRLTENVLWQSGSMWSAGMMDLSQSLDVEMDMYFGDQDASGADGMVFAFQQHWRQSRCDGVADVSTIKTLRNLIAALPPEDQPS